MDIALLEIGDPGDNDCTAEDYGEPQTESEDLYNGHQPTVNSSLKTLLEAIRELRADMEIVLEATSELTELIEDSYE